VLGAVDDLGARRVSIDTITDVQAFGPFPDRLPAFTAALIRSLEHRQVTSLVAAESQDVVSDYVKIPSPAIYATLENAILLRFVEDGNRLRQFIATPKGDRGHAVDLREFTISRDGMKVARR
jgi:circadian clock protein KaiC